MTQWFTNDIGLFLRHFRQQQCIVAIKKSITRAESLHFNFGVNLSLLASHGTFCKGFHAYSRVLMHMRGSLCIYKRFYAYSRLQVLVKCKTFAFDWSTDLVALGSSLSLSHSLLGLSAFRLLKLRDARYHASSFWHVTYNSVDWTKATP